MCGIVKTPEINNPAYLDLDMCGIVETPEIKTKDISDG